MPNEHILIPGTRLYIIPPSGFRLASNYLGMERDDSTSLHVTDYTFMNYFEESTRLIESQREGFITLEYKESSTVDGYSCKFWHTDNEFFGRGITFMFGDSSFMVTLLAIYKTDDLVVEEEIKKSLATVVYDKSVAMDYFAPLPIVIDSQHTPFILDRYTQDTFHYVSKGDEMDQALTVAVSVSKRILKTPKEIGQTIILSLKEDALSHAQITNESCDKIAGFEAYEVEMNSKDYFFYMAIVACGTCSIRLNYIVEGEKSDYHLQEVKKLLQTIRMK